jgi:hypothetical protein
MKLYWSYNSIPELADLPKEKRKEIWHACHLKGLAHWQTWGACLVCGLCCVTGSELGKLCYGRIGGFIGAMIAGGLGGLIAWEVTATMVRPHIREYLSSYGKTN